MSERRLWGSDFEEWIEDWLANGLDAHEKGGPDCTMRWLFCWDGREETAGHDCACCIMGYRMSEEMRKRDGFRCGCRCHQRVTSLASWMRSRYEIWLGTAERGGERQG